MSFAMIILFMIHFMKRMIEIYQDNEIIEEVKNVKRHAEKTV